MHRTFSATFKLLTGNEPFPWQTALYEEWFSQGKFPASCNLPTGLGKTSVIAIWLIALAHHPERVPRRLVYVVNRRTVVDQTTVEAAILRKNAEAAGVPVPAISTLRGEYADNREWSADPSRPAIIVGTVDMIGSRLLFSGYGIGFKAKPLHAGFLGQDVLLIHDEAHLEPAFQHLLKAIECEQHGGRVTFDGGCAGRGSQTTDFRPLRVMELTATSRGQGDVFTLTAEDKKSSVVKQRLGAKKAIVLHEERKLTEQIVELACAREDQNRAVIVFARSVEDVERIAAKLPKGRVQPLTGTMRGLEREQMLRTPVFQRFVPTSNRDELVTPAAGTVYLVCTSAGEVGVNISADDLVCDLSTFESMAQRCGRVNRFGTCKGTRIDVVHPTQFDAKNELDVRRARTLVLLQSLDGDGSPKSLSGLAKQNAEAVHAAFSPTPTILEASGILFDAWALTTIVRDKLPGRPTVEPYLHGISEWEPPETEVAWREEVGVITGDLRQQYDPEDLLEDYPLKPHELLRDNSSRVFDRLKKLGAIKETPVWIVSDDDSVEVTTLGKLIDAGKESLNYKTVLLPPSVGGLDGGMLTGGPTTASDVADEWFEDKEQSVKRRVRVWAEDPEFGEKTREMRLVRRIDLPSDNDDEEGRSWHWYARPRSADDDGSKTSRVATTWNHHTSDVEREARRLADSLLRAKPRLHAALVLAARFHDLGKRRGVWQRSIGNDDYPDKQYAKSGRLPNGGELRPREITDFRHEFGTLVDVLDENQPYLAELQKLDVEVQDVVLHLIAVHHGYGRPHFPIGNVLDPEPKGQNLTQIATKVQQRFAKLQREYGRWGLAYLESLLRAADWAASANPSPMEEACNE